MKNQWKASISGKLVIPIPMLLLALMFALFPLNGYNQSTSDVDPSLTSSDQNLAAVRFEGEVLFLVRGVSAIPAANRAFTINQRLRKAAADKSILVDSVKVILDTDRLLVYAGKQFIMNVYPVDAEAEGINLTLMGDIVKAKIMYVLKTYREERKPGAINEGLQKGAIGLVLTIAAVLVFIWIFRRAKYILKNRINNKSDLIQKISYKLIQPEHLFNALGGWYRMVRNIIIVLIILLGVNYILSLFPWTKSIANYVLQLFLDPVRQAGKGLLNYMPKFFFLVIIIITTRFILNLLKLFFNGIHHGAIDVHNFYAEWAMPAYQIIRFLVVVLAVVMAFPYIPFSDTGAFQGISVFLGLLLSLGSSSFISNIIAGYSLTFRRAFKTGDRILVNDTIGTVESQSLMVTRLRSTKNEEIIIPNSFLINTTVLNYSKKALNPGIILHTTVGIGYDTSWRQVEGMLVMAANRTEGLLKDPPPFVLQRALGDFAVTYEINAYCNDVTKLLYYYSKLHQNILDVFNEYDVQIMTPNYESDPDTPKVVPKENWTDPPAEGAVITVNPTNE